MPSDAKYYHAFNLIPNIGPLKFKKLIAYFSDLEKAWFAPCTEIIKSGISEEVSERICAERQRVNPETEWQKLTAQGIQAITIQDKDYPPLLKETYDPPAILYLRGQITNPNDTSLSVVGTRKPTSYGREVAFQLVGLLVQAQITIVSGLALGIDALSHQACLNFGGYTIAVLGGGVDDPSIYPRANWQLAQNIIRRGGALVSEYPPATRPLKQNFPQRNRIISGLSKGALIIEAGEKSGTLITARAALEQNREVFAVPGSIYNPCSRGTNYLIKIGAKLVTNIQDILEELNLSVLQEIPRNQKITPDNPEEALVLQHLSGEPIYIDALAKKTKLAPAKISTTLTILEMKGIVRNIGSANYVIAR
ncbi:MAG: DNA-processing protein DprA [Patescibacteria group bacterium]|nr:DNA-processing protein DprA [Patescibacteria group bacterium]